MSTRALGRSTRPKKLTPKQNVQIFREEQVDNINDLDAVRTQIETGVEKAEESEFHLQQAIQAAAGSLREEKAKDAYIPTPPTISSDIQYDVLYPTGWQQPNTYIRSSATVEDCNPISYCMDEEDELALKLIVAKGSPVSEDQFEEVMTFFEETVSVEQPYASVHNAPIMALTELLQHATESTPPAVKAYAKIIYEHWASRRQGKSNSALPPQLKFETHQETDEGDPYVCFRRREVRQTRKTRHRDQLSAEKLKKLRLELEAARNMLLAVRRREQQRKDLLEIDKQVAEQRQAFRELKRKLKQPGDDDLLIMQKKQKLPPVVPPDQQLTQQLPTRPGPELKTFEDLQADKQKAIAAEIQTNVDKHIRWNDGYWDKTMAPLTPDRENSSMGETPYLPAMATWSLPTPPASVSEHEVGKPGDVEMEDISRSSTPFRYASPDAEQDHNPMPAFRRRVGRGGRIIIDRKMPFRGPRYDDKFKFDHDSDDEMEDTALFGDSFMEQSTRQSNERSLLIARAAPQTASASDIQAANARRAQIEAVNTGHAPAAQLQPVTAAGSS